MIDAKQVKRCDAEIAHGGLCFKRATWQIQTAYCTMHYCSKHQKARKGCESKYFERKPFAEWEQVT